MPYLSNYRGDYLSRHQGGFGLSVIRKGLGALAKTAVGFMGGGPVGAAVGAAGAFGAGSLVKSLPKLPVPLPGGGTLRPFAAVPGGQPFYTPSTEAIPKGYRLNKSGYHLKDGTYIAPGTKVVKIRRRNFANGRALRRGIGRVQGFNRLVKSSRKSLRALSKI